MLNLICLFIVMISFTILTTTNSFILIYSLIFLFISIFILFVVFNINFLALSFLIVYIGAIAILFLFSVMIIGQEKSNSIFNLNYLNLFWNNFLVFSILIFFYRFISFFFSPYEVNLFPTISKVIISKDKTKFIEAYDEYVSTVQIETFMILNPKYYFMKKDSSITYNHFYQDFYRMQFKEDVSNVEETTIFGKIFKNENFSDLNVINSKLYEEFSILFIWSGLLLLISMLGVVSLLVPPRSHFFTKE